MLPRDLVVLALAAATRASPTGSGAGRGDTCQPDWVYSFGLKPRWELPRGSCLPTFTTFGEFIRATDFEDDRDPTKARAAGHRLPITPIPRAHQNAIVRRYWHARAAIISLALAAFAHVMPCYVLCTFLLQGWAPRLFQLPASEVPSLDALFTLVEEPVL